VAGSLRSAAGNGFRGLSRSVSELTSLEELAFFFSFFFSSLSSSSLSPQHVAGRFLFDSLKETLEYPGDTNLISRHGGWVVTCCLNQLSVSKKVNRQRYAFDGASCVSIWACVSMFSCMCKCKSVYVFMCICVYVCMYKAWVWVGANVCSKCVFLMGMCVQQQQQELEQYPLIEQYYLR